MRYKLTPLNISIVIFIIWNIYTTHFGSDPEGWGEYVFICMMFVALGGLALDFLIQFFFNKKYLITFSIEVLMLFSLFIYFKWWGREKTMIIPDNFRGGIAIVYGVPNEPALPISKFKFSYQLKIPKNGIVLTSTLKKDDYPKFEIITNSGKKSEYMQDKDSIYCHSLHERDFKYKNYEFDYDRWYITKNPNETPQMDEDSTIDKYLEQYCEQKNKNIR
jgi:hypothetical protein